MKIVKLYSWSYCPYCVHAKNLLKRKQVEFEDINLDGKDDELKNLIEKTGHRTVPQIFIGEEFIGGYSELSALDASGELDKKLNDSL